MAMKVLIWFTRMLAVALILFVLMFSLDAFGSGKPFGSQLIEFLIHSIPLFLLALALFVAWKNEIIGGAIFLLLTAALGIFWHSFSGNKASLIILIPFFLVGFLFILHGIILKRKL